MFLLDTNVLSALMRVTPPRKSRPSCPASPSNAFSPLLFVRPKFSPGWR
jgi:hypothetical protein